MTDIIETCKKVLERLSKMDFEKDGGISTEQLIFPKTRSRKSKEKKEIEIKNRISEQELRLLFIEEFKKKNKNLFYSIETPTEEKYKFGKAYKELKKTKEGQSASLDMCIFKRDSEEYKRTLNIEFKHTNTSIENIAKDILKLMAEKQDGAFIQLLDNTNRGTLSNGNVNQDGVLDKLRKSFVELKNNWNNENKCIHIIILSLRQQILIHREIRKSDLNNLDEIFLKCNEGEKGKNITEIKSNEWKSEKI